MKIKSFLLGSAAAAVAATGVQAADLPAVEPVEYVKVCDAFGAGFWYIPGSENCIKFSGFVRFDITYDDDDKGDDANNTNDDIANSLSAAFVDTSGDADWDFGGRTRLDIDVRSQTELGTLRAFMRLQGDLGSNGEDGAVEIDLAFLQFGLGGGIVTMGEIGLASNMNGTWTDDGAERIDEDPLGIRYDYSFGDVTLSASISDPDGTVVAGRDDYEIPDFAIGLDYSGDVFNAEIGANTVQFDDLASAVATNNEIGYLIGGTVGVDFDRWRARAGATYYGDSVFFALAPSRLNGTLFTVGFEDSGWSAFIGGQFDATETVSLQLTAEYANNTDAAGTELEDKFEVEGGFTWTPVTNFSVLGELKYTQIETASGVDADDFTGLLRFTRSF